MADATDIHNVHVYVHVRIFCPWMIISYAYGIHSKCMTLNAHTPYYRWWQIGEKYPINETRLFGTEWSASARLNLTSWSTASLATRASATNRTRSGALTQTGKEQSEVISS